METLLDFPGISTENVRLQALESEVRSLKNQFIAQKRENMDCIICFSGEWDKLFAALTIASGSLAMGNDVHLFFTFWAVSALRCTVKMHSNEKSFLQSMFNRMLPCGVRRAKLSRFNFGGIGKVLMKHIMKKKNIEDIEKLFQEVKDLGAHIHLCDTSAELFGLSCKELDDGDQMNTCGVATFFSYAQKSKTVLFI